MKLKKIILIGAIGCAPQRAPQTSDFGRQNYHINWAQNRAPTHEEIRPSEEAQDICRERTITTTDRPIRIRQNEEVVAEILAVNPTRTWGSRCGPIREVLITFQIAPSGTAEVIIPEQQLNGNVATTEITPRGSSTIRIAATLCSRNTVAVRVMTEQEGLETRSNGDRCPSQ